jgi:hypothetical protein
MNRPAAQAESGRRLLLACYHNENQAEAALRMALDREFPMDRISVLGSARSSGDDPLGIYYPGVGERMKGWGKMGAFWGGLWGLLTGAAGLFLVPGIGPLVAAGPVVEALAGAAGGAGVAGTAMAGAAALSQLGVAVHRMGVPEEAVDALQRFLSEGGYLLLLIVAEPDLATWRARLGATDADGLQDYPYLGFSDAVHKAVSG